MAAHKKSIRAGFQNSARLAFFRQSLKQALCRCAGCIVRIMRKLLCAFADRNKKRFSDLPLFFDVLRTKIEERAPYLPRIGCGKIFIA